MSSIYILVINYLILGGKGVDLEKMRLIIRGLTYMLSDISGW